MDTRMCAPCCSRPLTASQGEAGPVRGQVRGTHVRSSRGGACSFPPNTALSHLRCLQQGRADYARGTPWGHASLRNLRLRLLPFPRQLPKLPLFQSSSQVPARVDARLTLHSEISHAGALYSSIATHCPWFRGDRMPRIPHILFFVFILLL